MTSLVLPVLPGLGFGVKKKPTMSTVVANHISGREVRAQLYQSPIWQFEMPFDGLDGSPNGQYPGLGAQSMQSLLGFFLQCGGQFGTFLYYDPTDYLVTNQSFGVGNGTATSFQLTRAIGAFAENVIAPFVATTPTLFPLPGSATYAPMNVFQDAQMPWANGSVTGLTEANSQTDPGGGTTAMLVTETTAYSGHNVTWSTNPILAGSPVCFSAYLNGAGGERYVGVNAFANSGSGALNATFDLVGATVTHTLAGSGSSNLTTSMTALPGGWHRCSVSGILDSSSTNAKVSISGQPGSNNTGNSTYGGSTSNAFTIAWPQVELQTVAGVPGAYNPTLSTLYYGSPSILAAGIYVDPSTYTIANGIVTFNAAPSNGASLTWSGSFGFLCRFDDDTLDFDQFMSNLWQVESLKFRSVRGQ